MSWASSHIEKLQKGETVSFRPRGNSMKPKINSGDLVTVEPLAKNPEKDDIVLCKVKGNHFLHLVKAVDGDRFQIGNNRGGINGWIGLNGIYGKLIRVG